MNARPDDHRPRQGYLLLADISGYTAFPTGNELEHAHAIIHELTTLSRERLAPPMRFVKLGGDAVFCYAEAAAFQDGRRHLPQVSGVGAEAVIDSGDQYRPQDNSGHVELRAVAVSLGARLRPNSYWPKTMRAKIANQAAGMKTFCRSGLPANIS